MMCRRVLSAAAAEIRSERVWGEEGMRESLSIELMALKTLMELCDWSLWSGHKPESGRMTETEERREVNREGVEGGTQKLNQIL